MKRSPAKNTNYQKIIRSLKAQIQDLAARNLEVTAKAKALERELVSLDTSSSQMEVLFALKSGKVLKLNKNFADTVGSLKSQNENLCVGELFNRSESDKTAKLMELLKKNLKVSGFEHSILTMEGRRREVLIDVRRFGEGGAIFRLAMIDITELKSQENLLELSNKELREQVIQKGVEIEARNRQALDNTIHNEERRNIGAQIYVLLRKELEFILGKLNKSLSSNPEKTLGTVGPDGREVYRQVHDSLVSLLQGVFRQKDNSFDSTLVLGYLKRRAQENLVQKSIVLPRDVQPSVARFVNSLHLDIYDIRTAFFNLDFSAISKISQTLIGACQSYGLTPLNEAGEKIVASAQMKDRTQILKDIDNSDDKLRNLKIKYVGVNSKSPKVA